MKTVFSASPQTKRLRPADLYEYSIDNFWFKAAGLEDQKINEPLRGSHTADVVIIGGGYTGSILGLQYPAKISRKENRTVGRRLLRVRRQRQKRRFLYQHDLLHDYTIKDPQLLQDQIDVSFYGLKQIKQVIADHGVDCDFRENGMLNIAFSENQARQLEKYNEDLKSIGLESTFLEGKEIETEIKSPRVIAGQKMPHGAVINPAKLAREMKRVVEELGVEVRERTVVTRITPGKVNLVDTELGEIRAPTLVLGLNAYAPKLGLFKNRVIPVCTYIIATEPLSESQWESIGWKNRQGLADARVNFSYAVPSVDGRIVIGGGGDAVYYPKDRLSSGNEKTATRNIVKDLFTTFPQLEGLGIEHTWGGTTTLTVDRTPSVGTLKGYENIYYGGAYDEGVPTGQTAGRIIAELMAGEANKFTNHYLVNRKIPYAGPVVMRGFFINAYKQYLQRYD